jgi:hypothetical protein
VGRGCGTATGWRVPVAIAGSGGPLALCKAGAQ